eukprot:3296913-Lingulodinium_polyedra.AAC.1
MVVVGLGTATEAPAGAVVEHAVELRRAAEAGGLLPCCRPLVGRHGVEPLLLVDGHHLLRDPVVGRVGH